MVPKNIVGPPVRGKDLYGREKFIDVLWEKLQLTNVLLAAPRRFGKTSVMYHILDHPRDGYTIIHLDLEKITEPVNFVIELLDRINQDSKLARLVKSGFRKAGSALAKRIESLGIGAWGVEFKIELKEKIKGNWQDFANTVFSELKNCPEKVIFVFDELALMLENFDEYEIPVPEQKAFLQWFRQFRQDPSLGLRACRFLLGSSISIEQHLASMNMSAVINDFERIVLPELTPEQAAAFIDTLFRSEKVKVSAAAKRLMLELIGPAVPYFIQVFVSELCKAVKIKNRKPTPTLIRRIYQEEVLGVNCKHYFIHYHERLRHYDERHQIAKEFLKRLCLVESTPKSQLLHMYRQLSGESDIDGFNRLLSDLENDFYIKYDHAADAYYFATNVLKDWWKRYYAL
jgi:hypothetical protein